ncbi:hypothetical protein BPY_23140 [Bifidobacterium psychraerophilum]|uniref:hypothetical protein n=1 Tax=Bifidobacterium psychraerophilum TaxID=218140 RepID=UPI00310EDA9E
MNMTRIITAKIQPDIYTLIEDGVKHFEVRNESFEGADIIHYVSSETGETLGFYETDGSQSVISGQDRDLLALVSAVPIAFVEKLGLTALRQVYVAHIGGRVDNIEACLKWKGTK